MCFRTASFAILLACLATASHAAVILKVDATNTSAVVFTATSAAAQATYVDTENGSQLLLVGALDSSPRFGNALDGSLRAASSSSTYTFVFADNSIPGGGTGGYTNLNILGSGNATQSFTAGQTALVGTSTLNFFFATFPTANVTGDIYIRDRNGNVGTLVIGQYSLIVPEPTSLALAGLGGLTLLRRRR